MCPPRVVGGGKGVRNRSVSSKSGRRWLEDKSVSSKSGRRWFIRGLETGVCPPRVVGGGL